MRHWTAVFRLGLIGTLLLGFPAAARAEEDVPAGPAEIRALFEQLRPGMTVEEVAAATRRPRLARTGEPLTRWLTWSQPAGHTTAVLRAAFLDGRLSSLEYEAFGERYERLIKGADAVAISEEELRRLWRRGHAVDECREAVEAFHRLLLSVQDRLTVAEQQAWVRALELRRAAEGRRPAR